MGFLEFLPTSLPGLGSGVWRQLLEWQERSSNRNLWRKGGLSSQDRESQGLQLEAARGPTACRPGSRALSRFIGGQWRPQRSGKRRRRGRRGAKTPASVLIHSFIHSFTPSLIHSLLCSFILVHITPPTLPPFLISVYVSPAPTEHQTSC